MAWIELHDTLPDHPKVIRASASLKIDKDAFTGKLIRLWVWALNNREDGRLLEEEEDTIAEIMRFKGKPAGLIAALLDARLIEKTEDGYRIHDWEEHVSMLMAKREKKRAQTRERVKRNREKVLHDVEHNADDEEEGRHEGDECNETVTRYTSVTEDDCNADVTRYTSVTSTLRNTDVTRLPKPYLNQYIDDDDDYRAGAQAGARTRTQAPAREEDLREDEKSVLEDERFDGRLDSAQSAVRLAYLDAFGREALPAEVESIVRAAVISGTVEVAGEAVRRAAQHGARSVVPYVKTLLDQWAREGVKTVDELTDYEFQTDIEEGRLPRWLRPGGGAQ